MKFISFTRRSAAGLTAVVLCASISACGFSSSSDAETTVTLYEKASRYDYSLAWGSDDCLNSYIGEASQVVASAPAGFCRTLDPDDPLRLKLYLRGKPPGEWYINITLEEPGYLNWTFRADNLARRCSLPDCTDTEVLAPGGWVEAAGLGQQLRMPAAETASREAAQLQAQAAELRAEDQGLLDEDTAIHDEQVRLSEGRPPPAAVTELQDRREHLGEVEKDIKALFEDTQANLAAAFSGVPPPDAPRVLAQGRLRLVPVVAATVCSAIYSLGC